MLRNTRTLIFPFLPPSNLLADGGFLSSVSVKLRESKFGKKPITTSACIVNANDFFHVSHIEGEIIVI